MMKQLKRVLAILCIAALLITCTAGSVLAENNKKNTNSKPKIGKATSSEAYIKADKWPKAPKVESVGAVLMDAKTGVVLYAKNPDTRLYPASITKIMTGLLTLENLKLNKKMEFTAEAVEELPYNAVTIYAEEGEQMKVKDCLAAALVFSANDAASGLACAVSGNIADFAKLMNKRAEELGCKNTHFNNPHGLSDENHWTTPYDMCLILRECVKHSAFREIAGSKVYSMGKTNTNRDFFTFYSKHKMLFSTSPYYYENMVCGKTGYTTEAVNTLVTYAEKDGRGLLCCCMKAGYGVAYTDTKALFDYGFDKFRNKKINGESAQLLTEKTDLVSMLEAEYGEGTSFSIEGKSTLVLPNKVKIPDLALSFHDPEETPEGFFLDVDFMHQDTLLGSTRLKLDIPPAPEETKEASPILKITDDSEGDGGDPEERYADRTLQKAILNYSVVVNGYAVPIRYLLFGTVSLILVIMILLSLIRRRKNRRLREKLSKHDDFMHESKVQAAAEAAESKNSEAVDAPDKRAGEAAEDTDK